MAARQVHVRLNHSGSEWEDHRIIGCDALLFGTSVQTAQRHKPEDRICEWKMERQKYFI
jgi:hypothetical protein